MSIKNNKNKATVVNGIIVANNIKLPVIILERVLAQNNELNINGNINIKKNMNTIKYPVYLYFSFTTTISSSSVSSVFSSVFSSFLSSSALGSSCYYSFSELFS